MPGDEVQYKLMRLLQATPELSQRDVARELGISLGSANYCLRALVAKGWLKVSRFQNSRNKVAYRYILTPRGIREKAGQTVQFLRAKTREYEALRTEIRQMRREAIKSAAGSTRSDVAGVTARKLRDVFPS